jgi:SAM-dependent methyltransferase
VSPGTDNSTRFQGFADLYDRSRPTPPASLGPLLASYAGCPRPRVVDLGSGTGLSSRWAARWAASVTGIEPGDDMREAAAGRPLPNVTYRPGLSHATGLDGRSADVVLAVQAMHWMEPEPTLAEVARILRPGGVFAVLDADWPPVVGIWGAEAAWMTLDRRIRALEARMARGESGDTLVRPVLEGDPDVAAEDPTDPHVHRQLPGGLRSWSKSGHLGRMVASGHFPFTRELALAAPLEGSARRFVDLMASQGGYQGLRRRGLSDEEIGMAAFEEAVARAFADAPSVVELSFTWRVRLGITALG